MDERVRAILDEDRRDWQKLVSVLDAHPDERLHDPESPEWTARDVYNHLAHMMEWTARAIETAAADQPRMQPTSGMSEDDWNAELKRRYEHLSLEEARERAQAAFEQRIHAIESIPDDRWDDELFEIASHDGADHFRGHMSYIVTR
jgi:hypothetical protein